MVCNTKVERLINLSIHWASWDKAPHTLTLERRIISQPTVQYPRNTAFIIYRRDLCWGTRDTVVNTIPAGGGSVTAVEWDGLDLVVSNDDQFTVAVFLVSNLEVHDGYWLLKHVDLLYHHRLNAAVDKRCYSRLTECETYNKKGFIVEYHLLLVLVVYRENDAACPYLVPGDAWVLIALNMMPLSVAMKRTSTVLPSRKVTCGSTAILEKRYLELERLI